MWEAGSSPTKITAKPGVTPCSLSAAVSAAISARNWAAIAIGFQLVLGYGMAFVAYNLGSWLFYGAAFGLSQGIAIVLCLLALYFICRPAPKEKEISEAAAAKA